MVLMDPDFRSNSSQEDLYETELMVEIILPLETRNTEFLTFTTHSNEIDLSSYAIVAH